MARREAKPEKGVYSQPSLIDIQAKPDGLVIDRQKFDAIIKMKLNNGQPLYSCDGQTLRCYICNTNTSHSLFVKNIFCITCNTIHEVDYDKSS